MNFSEDVIQFFTKNSICLCVCSNKGSRKSNLVDDYYCKQWRGERDIVREKGLMSQKLSNKSSHRICEKSPKIGRRIMNHWCNKCTAMFSREVDNGKQLLKIEVHLITDLVGKQWIVYWSAFEFQKTAKPWRQNELTIHARSLIDTRVCKAQLGFCQEKKVYLKSFSVQMLTYFSKLPSYLLQYAERILWKQWKEHMFYLLMLKTVLLVRNRLLKLCKMKSKGVTNKMMWRFQNHFRIYLGTIRNK